MMAGRAPVGLMYRGGSAQRSASAAGFHSPFRSCEDLFRDGIESTLGVLRVGKEAGEDLGRLVALRGESIEGIKPMTPYRSGGKWDHRRERQRQRAGS